MNPYSEFNDANIELEYIDQDYQEPISTNNNNPGAMSYSDIFKNLNISVKNGRVQLNSRLPETEVIYQQQFEENYQPQFRPIQQQQQNPVVKTSKRVQFSQPVDPAVKNSAIYNKYFKDYRDPGEDRTEPARIPQTREEYIEMLREQQIQQQQQRAYISQIKPKRMMFSNNGVHNISINSSQNGANLNKLFRFSR